MFDIHKLTSHLTGFVETKIEILKLEAKERLSEFIVKAILIGIITLFIFIALLLALIGLSIKLNLLLQSAYLGYLITAASLIIVILCLVLFLDKDRIAQNLKNGFNKRDSNDKQ